MASSFRSFSIIAGMLLFLLCQATTGSAAESAIRLKYASFMPPTHPISLLSDQWCKELEKRTNGRVKVSYFPGGTLVTANQMYDGVVKGIVDVGFSITAYTPARMPLTEAFLLPLGFKSGEQATQAVSAFYKKFKPKEYDDVKVLYLHSHGPTPIHTKTPVKKIADLKGMRIKCNGDNARIVAALGGTPTTMPMLELYDSLKRGVADGTILPMETLKGWKLGEICHYTYDITSIGYANPFFVAMNKAKWNSLPKDIQDTIDKMSEEWIVKQGKLWNDLDAEALEMFKATQHITRATPEDEALAKQKVAPLLDAYVKRAKDKGVRGDEVVAWIQNYLKNAK